MVVGLSVTRAGDASSPGALLQAVTEGRQAGRALGQTAQASRCSAPAVRVKRCPRPMRKGTRPRYIESSDERRNLRSNQENPMSLGTRS